MKNKAIKTIKKSYSWIIKTWPRRLLASFLIILFVITPLSFLLFNKKTQAAWFDDNWYYRKSIDLTNNTSVENNVYVDVTLDTSDTAKFQTDCGDLRFTKYSGELLPYYVASGCGTASTSIHVNFDTFPSGSQTVFYYYGNPSAVNGFSTSDFATTASNYTVGSLGAEEKSPAPVAYWSFDEGQGTTAHDETSNKNDGTINGATWKPESECVSGKCLGFDGATDGVAISSPINLSTQFTISHWIRTSSAAGQMYTVGNAGSGNGYRFGVGGGHIAFLVGNNGGYTENTCGTTTVNDNKWHLITGVFSSASTFTCYIDGKFEASVNIVDFSGMSTQAPGIGDPPCCVDYQGTIDELKIYPYARTAAQIKLDYNAGLAGAGKAKEGASVAIGGSSDKWLTDGLVGHWKMDEGTGGTTNDSSGLGNNLTISGASWGSAGKFGSGLNFASGAGNNLYMSDSDSLDFGTNDFSVSYWAYHRDYTYPESVVSMHKGDQAYTDGHPGWEIGNSYDANGYRFAINDGTHKVNATVSMDAGYRPTDIQNKWAHVVFVFSRSTGKVKLFVNGIKQSSEVDISSVTGSINNALEFRIGNINGWQIDGLVDETRIYNRALSPGEVQKLYEWAPGPVGEWKFEEGSGNSAQDTSGNGRIATLAGSPIWSIGKIGKALDFNGSNNLTLTRFTLSPEITLEAWVKTTSTDSSASYAGNAAQNIFGDTTSGVYMGFGVHGGKVRYNYYNTSWNAVDGNTSVNDGKWHHISATHNRTIGTVIIYVDGKNDGTGSIVSASISGVDIIARGYSADYFNGSLDQLKIYNYARTQKQILEDMNGGQEGIQEPIAYYKFDEGYGTVAHDEGINKDNGDLLDGPTWDNDGKIGKALILDGLNDRVQEIAPAPFEYAGGDFSISLWAYRDSSESDGGYILSKPWNGNGEYNYRLTLNSNGTITLHLQGATTWSITTTDTLSTVTWTHLVVSISGNDKSVKIYKDGKLIKTGTHTISNWTPSSGNQNVTPCIGSLYPYGSGWAGNSTFSFKGKIDETKIYNYALTEDDVKTDFNRGASTVLGSTGTNSSGTPDNSSSREYCVPGDTTACAGPVAEWKFDEKVSGDSKTLYETSGNGNNGTTNDGANNTGMDCARPGKYGSACQFDGTDDGVVLDSTITLGNGNWTVSGWVKMAAGNGTLLSNNSGGPVSNEMNITSGKITYRNYDGNWQTHSGNTTINDGNWHYLSWINYSGNTMNMYVDGRLESGGGFNSYTTNGGPVNAIGYSYSTHMNGLIDNVIYYNYARTPAQIAWDYNKGGPVAEWRFDECQGGTVHDESGNGNNGTITLGASGQTANGTCTANANTPWYNGRTGKKNASLNFDGTDDKVSGGSFTVAASTTIAGWIKKTSSTSQRSFFSNRGASGNVYFGLNGAKVFFYDSSGTPPGITSASNIQIGQWQYVVAVSDGITTKFYVNGKLFYNASQSRTSSTGASFGIGWDPNIGTEYWDGQIDEVKIFNYALTEDQVKNIFNDGAINFR